MGQRGCPSEPHAKVFATAGVVAGTLAGAVTAVAGAPLGTSLDVPGAVELGVADAAGVAGAAAGVTGEAATALGAPCALEESLAGVFEHAAPNAAALTRSTAKAERAFRNGPTITAVVSLASRRPRPRVAAPN